MIPNKTAHSDAPKLLLVLAVFGASVVMLSPQMVQAQDNNDTGPAWNLGAVLGLEDSEPSWAQGSSVSLRNGVAARSFDRSAEPMYDPFYAVSLTLAPRFRINDTLWAGGMLILTREVTQSNITTERDDLLPSDLFLSFGASSFLTIPKLGTNLSADVQVNLPSSPFSSAQSLIAGIGPGLTLSQRFNVLSGLTVAWSVRATVNAHRYTTASLDQPRIGGCVNLEECARFYNTGVRNEQFRLANSFSAALAMIPQLSLSASAGIFQGFLYDTSEIEDADEDAQILEGQDTRYALGTQLALAYTPWPVMTAALGTSAIHPQRAPEGTVYTPWFNRFTQVNLDLTFRIP